MAQKITTRNPAAGKHGTRIDRAKYELIKGAILNAIGRRGQIGFSELLDTLEDELAAGFDGSVSWYATTVKLDLEAGGVIERIPRASPQQLRLVK